MEIQSPICTHFCCLALMRD